MSKQLVIITATIQQNTNSENSSPICVHLLSSQTCHRTHPKSLSTCQQLQHITEWYRWCPTRYSNSGT